LRRAEQLGADFVVNYAEQDFRAEVRRITAKRGVDVVVEHVGESTWEQSIGCLARNGRLVTTGATTGPNGAVNIDRLFGAQLSILGSFGGTRCELRTVLKMVAEENSAGDPCNLSARPGGAGTTTDGGTRAVWQVVSTTVTDKIILSGLEFYAYGGVSEAERQIGQRYRTHVELDLDLTRPAVSDAIEDTVHYGLVHDAVLAEARSRPFVLLESVAGRIADRLLRDFPVRRVTVQLQKLLPPIDGIVAYAAVEISRSRLD
jgi:dihydroneopterin aldolase